MLDIKKLKEMKPGTIFASGVINDERIANVEIKWLAKRGEGYHDWCIYYHNSDKSQAFIETQGDKMFTEVIIKDLVSCDEEAWDMYRF